jgi:hypothetical protein
MNFSQLRSLSALYQAELLRQADHERLLSQVRAGAPPARARLAVTLRSLAARIDPPEASLLAAARP